MEKCPPTNCCTKRSAGWPVDRKGIGEDDSKLVGPLIIPTKPEYEVADVFRLYGESYRNTHRLSLEQLKAMSAIETCRTAALGGHVDQCDQCGALRISYNSCRNRHCPKCGALAKERWLARQQADLLPIEYFHLVFTIDHEVNPLASFNE